MWNNTSLHSSSSSPSSSSSDYDFYRDVPDDGYPDDWQVVLAAIFIIMAFTSPALNLVIVFVICRSKELRTPTNTFIASLVLGEVIFSLFSLPFASASLLENSWPFSKSTCQGSAFMQTLGRTFSSYCLLLVCFDRYTAISRPLKYTNIITPPFSIISVVVVWCFAMLLCILLLIVWGTYSYAETLFLCTADNTSIIRSRGALVKQIVSNYVPIILTLTYLLAVVKEVKSHHRIFAMIPVPENPNITNTTSGTGSGHHVVGILPISRTIGGFNRNTRRALRSFFIMALSFVVCCSPLSISGLVKEDIDVAPVHPAVLVALGMSILYSIFIPVIVILFNRKIQSQLKHLALLVFCCSRVSHKPSQDIFTISSGLQSVLDTALIKTLRRGGKSSVTHSIRRARISVTT